MNRSTLLKRTFTIKVATMKFQTKGSHCEPPTNQHFAVNKDKWEDAGESMKNCTYCVMPKDTSQAWATLKIKSLLMEHWSGDISHISAICLFQLSK